MTDHAAQRPAALTITPRDRRFGAGSSPRPLVARRAGRSDRNLQCAVDHLPQGRGVLRRERARLSRRRSAAAGRGHQGLHHAGGDPQPRARPLQPSAPRWRATICPLLDERVELRLAIGRGRPPIVRPRRDHGARAFHGDPRAPIARRPAPPRRAPIAEAAELWRWHAAEEIEHKGVAYDTWLHATRALAAVRSAGRSRR